MWTHHGNGVPIYMSDPKDCVDEGGTSFWRHNSLKIENIPKTDFEAQHHGWPTYKECWWTTVYGDGLDRDKWDTILSVPDEV